MLCINWKSFSTTFYKFEKHFSLSIWQYIQLVNVVFQDGGQFLQSFCTRYWALFSQAVILCQFLSFGSIWFILLWSTYYCNMGFSRNEFKIRKIFGLKSISLKRKLLYFVNWHSGHHFWKQSVWKIVFIKKHLLQKNVDLNWIFLNT